MSTPPANPARPPTPNDPALSGAMIGTPRYLSQRVALAMPRAISSPAASSRRPHVRTTRTPSASSGITTASTASQPSFGHDCLVVRFVEWDHHADHGQHCSTNEERGHEDAERSGRFGRPRAEQRHPDAGHDEEHGARYDSGESDSDSTPWFVRCRYEHQAQQAEVLDRACDAEADQEPCAQLARPGTERERERCQAFRGRGPPGRTP